MSQLTRLLTDKNALNHTRIDAAPLAPVGEGEALLEIRRVAVTTNNITYAAFGDAMQYWNFFPTGRTAGATCRCGALPTWWLPPCRAWSQASASTATSRSPAICAMKPVRVTERGFYDGAEHRLSLTSAYNQYTRVKADPAYRAADENYQMLVRPLFITSFMLADFLQDNAFFGAKRLVVSSASSKTAYGTAFCLEGAAGHRTRRPDFQAQQGLRRRSRLLPPGGDL